MPRILLGGGFAAVLMGIGLAIPVLAEQLEGSQLTPLGGGFLAAALCLVIGGITAAMFGGRCGFASLPSGVRAAALANSLFLAFLALELSDRSVRQDGQLFYWTTFLFPPALVLFAGLLTGQRWAWWITRGIAALGVLWFVGFLVMVPFAPLQANGVPVPWYGRIYVACVTLALAGIFFVAFRALGDREARGYFQSVRTG